MSDNKTLAVFEPQEVYALASKVNTLVALGEVLISSGLLPTWIKTPQAAVTIIMKGMELKVGPMTALSLIYPINGVMTVAPQLGLALARRTGELEDLKIEDDGTTCKVTIKRKGQSPVTTTFSMEDAQRITYWDDKRRAEMPLAMKRNWQMWPREMRCWRAISANLKLTFSDAIHGLVLPDEAGAVTDVDGKPIEIVGKPELEESESPVIETSAPEIQAQIIEEGKPEPHVEYTQATVSVKDVCTQLRDMARKIVGGKPTELEVSRLAAVVNSAIREAYPDVEPTALDELRYKVYTAVSGVKVQSGADLPRGLVVAMLSRWSNPREKKGYAPNQQGIAEISAILKAFSAAESNSQAADETQSVQ